MLSKTQKTINSQKREIASFAKDVFGADYIWVLTGSNTYLKRSNFNHAHLRFSKKLSNNEYGDIYVYYTTSTTTNKTAKLDQKVKENLSDRCFNVRAELLQHNPLRACNYIFLVDYGTHFSYVTLEEAKKYVIDIHSLEGREVATVRLPKRFYKKERKSVSDDLLKFDARYIEHTTYSSYRKRGGFLKVEVFKNGELAAVQYFTSTGEFVADAKEKGIELKQGTVQKWARLGMSKRFDEKVFRFSKVESLQDSSALADCNSHDADQASCLPLQSYTDQLVYKKNVMVNIMNSNEEYELYSSRHQTPEVSHKTFDWDGLEEFL